MTSPGKASPNNNYLNGVTCASASQCWSVGSSEYNQAGPHAQTLIEEYSPTIPPLTAIGSRKIHGSTPFDLDLLNIPPSPPGIECRSVGGTDTAGVDYKIVFSFVNGVTNCGSTTTGSLSKGPNANQCTVDLTSVANQQYVTITLNNVLDSQNNTGNVAATMGVLIGDVNANGVVTNADVSLVKAQVAAGGNVDSSNFRDDINANGVITNADVSLTKAQVAAGAQLP